MPRIAHALVTGASSGLGREMVRQLVQDRDVTVLATASASRPTEQLAAKLPPGRVHVLAGNLIDAGFREQLWQQAIDLPGGLDLLINNAGAGNYAEFADQDPHAIRQIIELNVMALMDLSQKASRYMRSTLGPDPPDFLISWLCGNPLFGGLCRKQACRERAGQELELRIAGNGGPGLGGLSGSYSERIYQHGDWGRARSGRDPDRRAHGPSGTCNPPRTRRARDVSGAELDGLGRLEGRGVVSSAL